MSYTYLLLVLTFIVLSATVGCFPESRVVNGTVANIIEVPFIVSLRNDKGRHRCGGSIINSQWILSAAHCLVFTLPAEMTIQYGTSVISSDGKNIANVTRIIIHENYKQSDIGLVKLERPLIFNNKTVAPVKLPIKNFEIPQIAQGVPGVLVGWGRNETYGSVQKELQKVVLKIYSDEECQSRHNSTTTNDNICAGVDEGGKGQCSGDSGGPLIFKGDTQLGIVSWSVKPCTMAPYPGVYTKVSHYIDWIFDQINKTETEN